MKNAIVAAVLKKFKADITGSGKGSFKMGKLKFREGTKNLEVEGIEATWDFTESTFKMAEGKIEVGGKNNVKLSIARLIVTSEEDDGELILEGLEADSIQDIQSFSVFLPIDQLARLADLGDTKERL